MDITDQMSSGSKVYGDRLNELDARLYQKAHYEELKHKADLAQSLADALEGLCSAVTDIRGIDMNTYAETELTQARATLANYRKGE